MRLFKTLNRLAVAAIRRKLTVKRKPYTGETNNDPETV